MSSRLRNKVALITGASGEIGGATALEFGREGASGIGLHYNRSRKSADDISRELMGLGCQSLLLKANLSNPSQSKLMVEKTCDKFGKLDVLVCMAGHPFLSKDWNGKFEELTLTQLRKPLEVDLLGNTYAIQAAIPEMKRRRRGKIILIGSTPALTGDTVGITYLVAKAGLLALARALAQYLGPDNIHVNALALGAIDTKATMRHLGADQSRMLVEETSLKRLGTPSDVAKSIVFLASNDSDFITGQTIILDGGYAMR